MPPPAAVRRAIEVFPQRGAAAPRLSAWTFVLIVGIALAIRVWLLATVFHWPLVSEPALDGLDYLTLARRFATGALAGPLHHAPGYSIFLAAAFAALGENRFAVLLLQCVAGAVSCGLVASIATRYFGRREGAVAGLCLALYGPIAVLDVQILAESLLIVLLLSAVWLLVSERPGLAGVVMALAVVVRPMAAVVLLALSLFLIWRRAKDAAALFVCGWFTVLAPAVVATWMLAGVWQLQGHGGLNLYIGNSPAGTGTATVRLGGGHELLQTEAARHGALTSRDEDAYHLRKLGSEIKSDPAAWLQLMGRKLYLSVRDEEIRDTHGYDWFREVAPPLNWMLSFGIVAPFAAAGVVLCVWRGRIGAVPMLALLGTWATVVALVVGSRYRAPMVPFVCMYAGCGVIAVADGLRMRSRRVALAAGVAGLTAVVSCQGEVTARGDTAEEWALVGTAMIARGQLADAEAYLNRALEKDPANGLAWAGLGRLWIARGDLDRAEGAARRGLDANAQNPRAHQVLAVVAIARAAPELAVSHLQATAVTRPGSASAGLNQGLAMLREDQRAAVLADLSREAERAGPGAGPIPGAVEQMIKRRATIGAGRSGAPLRGGALATDDGSLENGAWMTNEDVREESTR
jgi:4-amino-4-deoxy-L-arabinose transferase-like glycosyltransferase